MPSIMDKLKKDQDKQLVPKLIQEAVNELRAVNTWFGRVNSTKDTGDYKEMLNNRSSLRRAKEAAETLIEIFTIMQKEMSKSFRVEGKSKPSPSKLIYKGATYVRVADKEAVDEGWRYLSEDFQLVFDSKFQLTNHIGSMASTIKDMGPSYRQYVDELNDLKKRIAGDCDKKLRSIQHRLEEQIGKDLGGKVVINW